MAHETVNLGLLKPGAEDFYDIEVHNRNMDILDAACQEGKNAVRSVQIGGVEQEKTDGVVNLPAYPEGYVHPDAPGSRHIPAGGITGQVLGWEKNGTAEWISIGNTIQQTIIPSAEWKGNGDFYSNTISVPNATANNVIELTVPSDITANQVAAYQVAQIINGSQADGSVTVYAWGDIPTIDLPVTVIVRGNV